MPTPLEKLLILTRQLRDPETGCEWDRVQTFSSLTPCTLEETYEVIDAIDRDDHAELKQELGDLLFQIVFYADLAKDQGLFDFDDVCQAISDKLIRRHPHLFDAQGERLPLNARQSKPNWEQLKQQERNGKLQYSLLDDIPRSLPALMQAEKIQKRCASVGFDWHALSPVLEKVHEELAEVEAEIARQPNNKQYIAEEVGDLLFATVNLTRHLKLKPEQVLQQANAKFSRRFRQIEAQLQAQQRSLASASLTEMEALWQAVKQAEVRDKD